MQNFDWTSFTRKVAVRAQLRELYDAWTKTDKIESWFLQKAAYIRDGEILSPNASVLAEDVYHWNWYLYDETEEGRYTAANGKDHVQFTFAGDCLVDVHLNQEGEHVVVTITQSNIPTDDGSKCGIRLGCDTGWSFYLVNLKSVYEGGLDLRNKNEALKGLINN